VSTNHASATESTSETGWQDLPVEHLQLAPNITAALRDGGISTLGEACTVAEGRLAGYAPYAPELVEAVDQLRLAQRDEAIDWRRYWGLRDNRFHHLAAALPELDNLATVAGIAEVTRETMGNAGAMLRSGGIGTMSELIEGLRPGIGPVQGLGRKKLDELFARLMVLMAEASGGDWPASLKTPEMGAASCSRIELCAEARALPLSILQLGAKGHLIQKAGFQTVGDIADTDLHSLRRLSSVGNSTVMLLRERLAALGEAGKDGVLDWQRFAEAAEMPLLPAGPVATGADLITVLPHVLAKLAGYLRDDSYRDILANRLCCAAREQATLDEIGLRSIPPVTRERIRQKESKLLLQLTGALVWDRDGKLGVQFHPDFIGWWRRAAAEFEGVDEIGFDEFVERLADTWEVTFDQLVPHLPFIIAIVTGEARMPASFRAGARLDHRLRNLSPETAATPVLRFRLGRAGQRLAERGIMTLANLVQLASQGELSNALETGLARIADAVRKDGTMDWQVYASVMQLETLPSRTPASANVFVGEFGGTVGDLLQRLHSTDRCARIFELRTRHPANSRPTLARIAEALKTHGPTVKREETDFLEELHNILVDREFAEVPVWLDQSWLDYCTEAFSSFRSSESDYGRFHAGLALRWNMPLSHAAEAAPGLWAIFTGYPQGRHRRAEMQEEPYLSVEPAARIQLRGFRRLH
jgi:hypothetical protein